MDKPEDNMAMVPNTTVPNVSMLLVGEHKPNYRPRDIRAINARLIVVNERKRPLNYDKVEVIARSFLTEGQLQPIGVKQLKGEYKYRLIYGDHRRAAAVSLEQSGRGNASITAAIFPEDMPDWRCELAEIAENLMRQDLSIVESTAHWIHYAEILKRHDLVITRAQKISETKKADKTPIPSGTTSDNRMLSKPTVSEEIASASGKRKGLIDDRVRKAVALAEEMGVEIPKDKARTLEELPPDKLAEIREATLKAPPKVRKNVTNKLFPNEVITPTRTRLIVDIVDPKPFIEFCRRHVQGKTKPMSLNTLKAYRAALDELIKEIEAQ